MDDAFDRMAATGERLVPNYTPCDPRDQVAHITRYEWARQFCKDRAVLDAACGCGYGTAILADVAHSVHGIDISSEAIAYAWKNYCRTNVGFEVRQVEQLNNIPGRFDVIVSFETIEHLFRPSRMLRQVHLKLAPYGLFIVSAPEGSASAWHFWNFNKLDLLGTLRTQFGDVPISYYAQNFGSQIVKDGEFEFSEKAPRTHIFVVEVH